MRLERKTKGRGARHETRSNVSVMKGDECFGVSLASSNTSMTTALADGRARRPRSSGEMLRADVALLASAALQLLEDRRVALIVCDETLRVLAATPRARELVGCPAGSALLPEAIEGVVRMQLNDEYSSEQLTVVHAANRSVSLTIRVRPIDALSPAAIAVTVSEVIVEPVLDLRALAGEMGLSLRQRQLFQLVRSGLSNRDIAARLRLSEGTVKVYLHKLFEKVGVDSRTRLVAHVEQLLQASRPGER
jgi:DNA-binding NarL/FixJ family response regulator